ncbi:hypothetical protein D3C81_2306790 [compost metagenome]
MLHHQLVVEGEGMVVVRLLPFGHAKLRLVLIVVVLRDERHFIRVQLADNRAGDRRFSGPGAAGDTYD